MCPPVPQRVDYLHVMADLLQQTLYEDVVPDVVADQPPVHIRGLSGLDIGTGAGDGYVEVMMIYLKIFEVESSKQDDAVCSYHPVQAWVVFSYLFLIISHKVFADDP